MKIKVYGDIYCWNYLVRTDYIGLSIAPINYIDLMPISFGEEFVCETIVSLSPEEIDKLKTVSVGSENYNIARKRYDITEDCWIVVLDGYKEDEERSQMNLDKARLEKEKRELEQKQVREELQIKTNKPNKKWYEFWR